RHSGSYLVTSV
nr:Chain G, 11-mer peptide from Adenomatous polyposis coli protein [Homo sapiens]3RL7_H Chain H, 11-mer peptide from Adenomatous polyposis coli protein [Homo sapiens]3RL7_I Chain I, 11-mer peptide from Adenomatous polyposis coli protein [Homo sapiens]3RL7_J Chain J, 11-mer peptide from Adenomatous polyposis coli protein [Homo sapiens]3RL7_K Chain K, 11-mer peptide from Adenomatous polyposis coli protein [Homo sapiens]3RL7_L Chain L, 11-mer peptide from Adenomatous polyposis coli protein [Homo 